MPRIRETVERHAADVPVFPWVATQLVEVVERPDAELCQLEELVAQDAGIASRLLRTANSPLFRGVVSVDSLAEAIRRVGFRETKNIALTAACAALYDVQDRAEREIFPDAWASLWHEAMLGAFGSRLMAREEAIGCPEQAFSAGLFRNIGSLLVLRAVSRGLVTGELRGPLAWDDFAPLLAELQGNVGATYLRRCGLPVETVIAALHHRDAELPSGVETPALHLVRIIDGLIDATQSETSTADAMPDHARNSAAAIGLGADRLDYYALQLTGLAEQLREIA